MVYVLGKDPLGTPDVRGKIGFLSHQSFLDPWETVAEQVTFCFSLRGGGEPSPERLRDLLKLEEYWLAPFGSLSRGYQRRTELACVLAGGPELLLLDEPLAGLDVEHRAGLPEVVRELAPEAAVLLASHLPESLASLCPHGLPLVEGVAGDRFLLTTTG
jgi:ABC-2 type transport system ATP-binding protein